MDPRAYAEGLAIARKLPPGHLVEVCRAQKQEAEDATKALREKWQQWWDLWQNEVVFDGKEDWQSQVWIAKPFAAVEEASSLIRRSLLDSPSWFDIDGTDDWDKILAGHLWRPLLKLLLDKAGFIEKFSDACKVGFITGVAGYLKYRWSATRVPMLAGATVDPTTGMILPSFQSQLRSILCIDYVLPWNIFRDPDSMPRENFSGAYLWHAEWKGRAIIRAMAEMGWDPEAVGRLLARKGSSYSESIDTSQSTGQRRQAERKQYLAWTRSRFREDWLVNEGWLDLPDENGEIILPNALLITADDEVLYGPGPNPLWATDLQTGRRKWPFIATTPIVHPARFEGRGILEADEGLSWLFCNTFNLLADAQNWEVNPDYELFEQGLVDFDDIARYPGKPWLKNTPQPVLTPAAVGRVDTGKVLAFLEYTDKQRENTNFVNQYVQGAPTTRDVTARETTIKTDQSLGMFAGMGRNLEAGGRAGVELAYDMALQFMAGNDFTDPSIVGILGAEIAQLASTWDLKTRIAQLQGSFDFTFSGVSAALQKAEQLTKLMQFGTLAASGPYAGWTKPWQILRAIADLMNLGSRIDIGEPGPAPGLAGPGMVPPPGAPVPPQPGTPAGVEPSAPPGGPLQNPAGMMRAVGAGEGAVA